MREHWPKLVIVGLLLLIVGVPFLLRPQASGETAADDGDRLIIFTPHNEQIRYEMARGFNLWREAEGLPPVAFDWRSSGGTSDLRKQTLAQFQALALAGREDDGIGVDLFFGGGEYEHNQLVRGVTVERDGEPVSIPVVVPIEMPSELFEAAFPEPTIGGERLYHPDRYWVGVVLASFGIVYNTDVLDMLDLPEPRTWADLTDPRYVGWVALADPAHSGSIAATYDTIVRRSGWEEGWAMLRRSFANARYFTASASKVPVDVSAGEAAAGMCIDFYGRFQAGAIAAGSGATDGQGRVGYVDPAGMTATTADPISILRGAPHHDLAQQFVAWLLTTDAQRLWQRKLGTEGGPARFELRRQPIRRDLYTPEEKRHWADPQITPFADARPFESWMPSYYTMVAPLAHAMAIDVHQELVAAWRAIQSTPADHPSRAEMLALFDAMPPELQMPWSDEGLASSWRVAAEDPSHPRHDEALATIAAFGTSLSERYADRDQLLKDRVAWTLFFRDNYQKIVALAP